MQKNLVFSVVLLLAVAGCSHVGDHGHGHGDGGHGDDSNGAMGARLAKYETVRLTADLSGLSDGRQKMLRLLIEACHPMDEAFWMQAYGDAKPLLDGLSDEPTRRFTEINYGPWDRLDGNAPFIDGTGAKPAGANFYPADATKEELERAIAGDDAAAASLTSLYTLVRRDDDGAFVTVPYHEAFADQVRTTAAKLREAAQLAEDAGFKRYLELRAKALEDDDYQPSDLAWMDMKTNAIDVVIGPIETYEDELFGYKASYEGYVLIKDLSWSERLARYAGMLPGLQRGLPVPEAYKQEQPGGQADLNAYDVVFYAGHSNAGSKTIAINLPNDEQVQLSKGTRRLQLKNVMRAKFDRILLPIARELIAEDQFEHVTFDGFFNNTMFHEVAHGLGIKNTLDGKGTVRHALKEQASSVEEGKADVLGLYMVARLHEQGELPDVTLEEHYVTFLASVFRSIRFGTSSAHGLANMARFNYFKERGAFTYEGGRYRVDFARFKEAMDALSGKLLQLQGDGDYEATRVFMQEMTRMGSDLQGNLEQLAAAGIPVDIVFEQGVEALGLSQ